MDTVNHLLMSQRFYLGAEGSLHFTLVVESAADFYVESYNDSRLRISGECGQNIRPSDFKKHKINGVALDKLVAENFFSQNYFVHEQEPQIPPTTKVA